MKSLAIPLLLAPALAAAGDCKHEERRVIEPSLEGVSTVRFEVNSHDLALRGGAGDAPARLDVRACASEAGYLPQLVVATRRDGDTLVVTLERQGQSMGIFFSPTYANLTVEASLPAGLAYEVDVGSGDAEVRDVATLVEARVGSGDIDIDGAGGLHVHAVGSGDLEARRIRGDARVDGVGSGDVRLARVDGSVTVGRVGSGDVDVADVAGDLVVDGIGSGDVRHRGVRGKVTLPAD